MIKRNQLSTKLIILASLILLTISTTMISVRAFDLDPGGGGGSDTTPPTLTITSPGNNNMRGRTVTVRWTTYDASGIDKNYVKVDSGSWIYKGTGTSHTFSSLSNKKIHTFYVKSYDKKGNIAYKSVKIYSLESGDYELRMFTTHKTIWCPDRVQEYAEETITLESKTRFEFDSSTGKVTYESFFYQTTIDYSGNFISRSPTIGGMNFLFDVYYFRVYQYYDGEQHSADYPSGVWVDSDYYYGRTLSLPISGCYNYNKIYIVFEFFSEINYYNDVWSFDCKHKLNGFPTTSYFTQNTNTYPPSPLGIEWTYQTISSTLSLTSV